MSYGHHTLLIKLYYFNWIEIVVETKTEQVKNKYLYYIKISNITCLIVNNYYRNKILKIRSIENLFIDYIIE